MMHDFLPTVSIPTTNWWWCARTTGGREAML